MTQIVEMVTEEEKKPILLEFLSRLEPTQKALVFASKKIKADDLTSDLILRGGFSVQSIHGDRAQEDPNTPNTCLLYTSPSPRDRQKSRMPSSA